VTHPRHARIGQVASTAGFAIAGMARLRHHRLVPGPSPLLSRQASGGLLVLAALLSVSCSGTGPSESEKAKLKEYDQLMTYLQTPAYGASRPISGKIMFGQETSMIGLCRTERTTCVLPTNVDGSDQPCWLVFTGAGTASLERLTGRRDPGDGEYWIEGDGRIAVEPGGFGHLSRYTCQVEVSRVRAFEEGPPWMWSPPPLDSRSGRH
jgi:hypothetical protein